MQITRLSKIILLILVFFIAFSSVSSAARKKKKSHSPAPSCRAAILSDSTRAKRLYGKNVNMKVLPASTTKVMTAILVLEKLSLDQYVTVSRRATLASPSKINVVVGEQYLVRDLLLATLISSANDASVVLAEAVAGSEWQFVQMMNQRARQIGAKHTKFANSHGLPSAKGTQYTTAYDMYLIFREALKKSFFQKAIRYRSKTVYSKAGRAIPLHNHNKMLFLGWKKNVYGKTGYTHAAQGCFVGTLQKGDSTIIVAVFGCTKRWDFIKNIVRNHAGVAL